MTAVVTGVVAEAAVTRSTTSDRALVTIAQIDESDALLLLLPPSCPLIILEGDVHVNVVIVSVL